MAAYTPRILFQTWKTYDIPEDLLEFRKEWIKLTPNYSHPLFDDNDLRNEIIKIVPQYLSAYDNFSSNIERVDFARYAILYGKGGVYSDLDLYPIRSIDPLVKMNKVILGTEPKEHIISKTYPVVLCNAFMISPPNHSMWKALMKYIIDNYEENDNPVETTGPGVMSKFYRDYPEYFSDVIITSPCFFYPLTSKNEISKECIGSKDTYVCHVWKNTWVKPWYASKKIWKKKYWILGISIIILIIIFAYILFFRRKK